MKNKRINNPKVSPGMIVFSRGLLYPSGRLKIGLAGLIALTMLIACGIVYLTGGTKLAYVHLFYIPIIISGFIFSVTGGVVVALLSGAMMGPFMPSDIEQHIAQPTMSWIIRIGLFSIMGAIAGFGSKVFRSYIIERESKLTTDSVTGLPTVIGLEEIFKRITDDSKANLYVMAIELFHHNQLDQAFGPNGILSLVFQTRDCLLKNLPDTVFIGHVDSKSFVLLVPASEDINKILNLCKNSLSGTFMVDSVPIFLEFHYGIAKYHEDGNSLDQLIRKAKIAVYKSEKMGTDQAFFDREESNRIQKNIVILHSLRQAIEQKTLDLHYQPKVSLETNEPIGFEALARWVHPQLGAISPAEFIPLLENTLLVNPFTEWVLEETMKQAAILRAQGIKQTFSVNFSMNNFHDASIVNKILAILQKNDIPPRYLEIEITESAIATDITKVSDLMHKLRAHGIRIAIDDFGTGQSSLQYLFKLPLDVLKIDRTFVSAMMSNPGAAAIVRSAILLGHELNLEVVGEGVETREEFEMLKKLGCDMVQGYLMAPPMEIQEATNWLKESLGLVNVGKKAGQPVP